MVLTQNFLNLSRDIEAFVRNFGKWIEEKGQELILEAERLVREIENIQIEIQMYRSSFVTEFDANDVSVVWTKRFVSMSSINVSCFLNIISDKRCHYRPCGLRRAH